MGVLVSHDFLSGREVCRKKDQMRGTAILRVNLQDEGLSRVRVSRPSPHNPPLAFILLEDEGSCLSSVRCLRRWGRRRGGITAHQDPTNRNDKAGHSHQTPPRSLNWPHADRRCETLPQLSFEHNLRRPAGVRAPCRNPACPALPWERSAGSLSAKLAAGKIACERMVGPSGRLSNFPASSKGDQGIFNFDHLVPGARL